LCVEDFASGCLPFSILPGNPYDGHTLPTVIPAMEDMIGNTTERLLADAGYRGHNAPIDYKFRVYTSGQKRRLTPQIKRELRRRAAIEPVIGHLKAERTAWAAIILHTVPAMPLTPCWPPPVITSISCLDGWSSCCLDSRRLRKQRPRLRVVGEIARTAALFVRHFRFSSPVPGLGLSTGERARIRA
jgi:hypothetical protein